MSSFAYGAVTRKRVQASAVTSTTAEPPGLKTYIDTLAGLVPAEVLTFHAFMLQATTETKQVGGKAVTTITERGALQGTFVFCLVMSVVLFVAGRVMSADASSGWKPSDYIRAAVPPVAFVLWTIIQKSTAWDAIAPGDVSDAWRALIGGGGAVVLGVVATALGIKAHKAAAGNG